MSVESVIVIEVIVIISHIKKVSLCFQNALDNQSHNFPPKENMLRRGSATLHIMTVSGRHVLLSSLVATKSGFLFWGGCDAFLESNFGEWFIIYIGSFFVASPGKVIF